MKIVVDTNTLVSGFLWKGTPARLLAAAFSGHARLFTSTALLQELQEVLQRPKFAARFLSGNETPAGIFERYRNASVKIISPKIKPPAALQDPDDVHVLACAIAAGAGAIVSGDDDLLMLGSFEGIPIINAIEALRRF